MNSVTLRLEFDDGGGFLPPSVGFTLCDLSVTGNLGSVSSAGRIPNASMMIAPSAAHLLLIALRLSAHGNGRGVEIFDATASPFSLAFVRERDQVAITHRGQAVHRGPAADVMAAVRGDLIPLAERLLSIAAVDDSSVRDLSESLVAFRAA